MLQNIIVYIIVSICVLYMGKSIYNTLTVKKKSSCKGCPGCNLKDKTDSCNKKQ